ncbi:Phosphoglucomutase, chloroplastic [Porphyridium purpureum]|uniref:phosphoglucomutase (alpha-D-glucose-1,6-bisphosphate-dependent) n=1 Tax=Porphyridium purpureum TaxID=35688 RepID=A0A5J4Z7N3_PORPP|nr:Phosphoglucomutase, chloroplastic [Porphyridium purpureum]|eukprot:POR1570..scf295_1
MVGYVVKSVATAPIDGQKTGTSGLRKKTAVFSSPNYLANWVQSLFYSLDGLAGATIALGGDGRYFSKEAIQIIARLAAGNGVAKLVVGQKGIMCTPAMSCVIRESKLYGGIILTASHNPGGPDEDFGIKYNTGNGGPAPESVTDAIFAHTKSISELKFAFAEDGSEDPFASADISKLGSTTFTTAGGSFEIEVISPTEQYVAMLKGMFDFTSMKALLAREDFKMLFDGMSGVTGPYARRLFVEELGAPESSLMRCEPLPDFGKGHPDPNLTYAAELVKHMDPKQNSDAPDFGAASDGDGDRNMILGKGFFVTPNDSVAVIAAEATSAIPYFQKHGLKGVARSMPTAGAIDKVAAKLGLECFVTPTGWKFFGNLMDAGRVQICGEESFGTGADHVREKDGLFAVLSWLQILAYKNADSSKPLVSVEAIVKEFWSTYGRNFFSRYDYEGVESDAANKMMAHLEKIQEDMNASKDPSGLMTLGGFATKVKLAENFTYKDPVDGSVASKQGILFVFEEDSRIIFRLSGTGSAGATIRMYIEKYEPDATQTDKDAQVALKPLIDLALEVSQLKEFTGRNEPTVIT